MYRVKHSRFIVAVALLGLLAATLACAVGTPQAAAKPTVVITFPPAGTTFAIGQDVVVQSVAADPQGISRVELWVDGQIVHTQAVVPAATSYAASQPWKPAVLGSHIVEVRAFNVSNATNDPAQVVVNVAETVANVPTPGAAEVPTPTPVPPGVDTPTPATPPTETPVPATLPYGGAPTIVALIGLNVRSGPGTAYPVIGGLPAGQATRITGQNADGTWWQIVYPPDSGGRGWVSAGAQYGTAYNTESVPIVETPPPPTYTPTNTPPPTYTPTNTPPPTHTPTNTPPPQAPVIYFFQSDHSTITAGQSATLSWDLANAQWAHLRYGSIEEGVVAPGNKTVSPGSTTTYTLIAHNAAGDTTAQVTITVNPSGPETVYNFIDKASSAHWYNNSGTTLPFPGSDVDDRGFALIRAGYQLEDNSTPSKALETHPRWVDDGGITGEYDVNVTIQSGDKFKSKIGFLKGAGAGNARWVLGYRDSGGYHVLADAHKAYNGSLISFEVNLSSLAGKKVKFDLTVWANGSASQDWAIWLNPRLERP